MFWKKKPVTADDGLDRLAREIARSSATNDEEAEAVVSSPFLYSRLRARIANERERRADPFNAWFATLAAARRAIPALVLVALAFAAVFWFTRAGAPPAGDSNAVPLDLPEMATGGIAPIQACSISNDAGCNVSTDEVIATLFSEGRQELR